MSTFLFKSLKQAFCIDLKPATPELEKVRIFCPDKISDQIDQISKNFFHYLYIILYLKDNFILTLT